MIILKTEVRILRNIKGFNFVTKLEGDGVEKLVTSALCSLNYDFKKTCEMNSLEKLKLYENDVVTGDIFKHEMISGVYKSEKMPTVLLNEQEHIVIQDSAKGFELANLYDNVNKVDDFLSEKLDYAFSEEFGYLTSDPNFCGNAMTATVTLHLPATAYYGTDSLVESLGRLGYRVSTLASEKGSINSIMRISPDRTIGVSEEEYIKKLENITREIVDMEEQNRKKLYLDDSINLEDMVNRAFGTLSYCRMISEMEVIERLSDLFLGIELSILKPKVDLSLTELIAKFKNGRLQVEVGSLLDMKSRDILRAREVRKMMKEVF